LTNNRRDDPTFEFEQHYRRAGKNLIAGVDEVGRGPLAGPVLACAVILAQDYFLPGIRDSKKLSAHKRRELAAVLKREALCWAVGSASVEEIEQFNIRQATFMAMRRALASLPLKPDFVLVDGENLTGSPCDSTGIIGGDSRSVTIAAASIIAKVERDRLMTELDRVYPVYRFAQNKGYGTRVHIELLRRYGPSAQHRLSFLRKILSRPPGDLPGVRPPSPIR